jgi:REP element-mobilizing transposase RayT
MARKARAEVEGGLYHVITRGNNRRPIFNAPADYEKFLALLALQKRKLPFFLYAYCLMTNHVHLLIERQADTIGRIMHRVLTGYSQYYNRRYHRVGHLLQGRHKSILCQSERYLAELVRYIHLNPVRAKLVRRPEQYKYSGHGAYLGMEAVGIVDVEPVLRHFGAKKELARKAYRQFIAAGMKLGRQAELYAAEGGRILGSEEFVDTTIHRIGETGPQVPASVQAMQEFKPGALLGAIENVCQISRVEFCGPGKSSRVLRAKEIFVLIGREAGGTPKALGEISGMSHSTVSRRYDAARLKAAENGELNELADGVRRLYHGVD